MSNEEISLSNAKKLDRIVQLLEGDGIDAPRLLHRVAGHEETLYGTRGNNGLTHKVNIMWRIHIWLLCTLSAAGGFVIKSMTEKILKP